MEISSGLRRTLLLAAALGVAVLAPAGVSAEWQEQMASAT